jgi:hypothetical protein
VPHTCRALKLRTIGGELRLLAGLNHERRHRADQRCLGQGLQPRRRDDLAPALGSDGAVPPVLNGINHIAV